MSFVLLGILNSQAAGGGAGSVYRFQIIGDTQTDLGVALSDSSGSGVYSGWTTGSGSSLESGYVASVAADGTENWSRTLRSSTTKVVNFAGQALDTSGNIYIAARTSDLPSIPQYVLLAVKYDSSGSIQWQKALHNSGLNPENYNGIVDSSGNFILVGADGTNDAIITKYNSSGGLVFQKLLDFGGTNFLYNVTTDSSGNIYVVGFGGEMKNEPVVAKLNSSLVLQWARAIDINGRGYGIAVDSSGNVYFCGRSESADYAFLAKLNSSGTLQWQKKMNGSSTSNQFWDLKIDSNNDILVTGRVFSTSNGAPLVKFDSSGNVVYQRFIRKASTTIEGRSLKLDANENPMLGGYAAGSVSYDFFGAVVPSDGSLTGSYTLDSATIEYIVSSFTIATSTYTFYDVTPAVTSGSLSQLTPTLVDDAGTLPISSVTL